MADPFEDARLRLSRAEERIVEFETLVADFVGRNPWQIVCEFDAGRNKYVHKLAIRERLDPKARVIVAETLGAIRSCLDLTASATARLAEPGVRHKCHFPFLKKPNEWESFRNRQCGGIPEAVTDYFWSLKPYPGGNDWLFGLNSVRNEGEHWAMAPTVMATLAISIYFPDQTRSLFNFGRDQMELDEIELFTTAEKKSDFKAFIPCKVQFESSAEFGDAACESVMKELHRKAGEIVNQTEDICQDLGLL